MNMLLSFPGGSEVMLIIVLFLIIVCMPIAAIFYYFKSQRLANELNRLKEESYKMRNSASEMSNTGWQSSEQM